MYKTRCKKMSNCVLLLISEPPLFSLLAFVPLHEDFQKPPTAPVCIEHTWLSACRFPDIILVVCLVWKNPAGAPETVLGDKYHCLVYPDLRIAGGGLILQMFTEPIQFI